MPLKILNLTSTRYGIGGVESLLLAAAGKYDADRFLIAYCNLFCDTNGDGEFPTALKRRHLNYFHVSGRRPKDLPALVANLVRLLRQERFDVLHMHMLQATLVGQVAARLARVPVRLVTRHYSEAGVQNKKGMLIKSLDTRLTRNATQVIAVSKAVREALVNDEGIPSDRVIVIHNGIDLAAFDSASLEHPLPWDCSWGSRLLIGSI